MTRLRGVARRTRARIVAPIVLLAACTACAREGPSKPAAERHAAERPAAEGHPATVAPAEPPAPQEEDAGISALAAFAASDGADADGGVLQTEERDRDPRSETVTIKLMVEPARCAHVFWGVKDLGVAPLEITRPRGTGPLDLVLRCPGTLPYHTRAFTDRDDKIAVHMVAEPGAAHLLGYRGPWSSAEPKHDRVGKSQGSPRAPNNAPQPGGPSDSKADDKNESADDDKNRDGEPLRQSLGPSLGTSPRPDAGGPDSP